MWSGQRRQKGLSDELAVRPDVGRWASQGSGSVCAEAQGGKPILWEQLECGFRAGVGRRRGRGMRGGDRGSGREAGGQGSAVGLPRACLHGNPEASASPGRGWLSRSGPRARDRAPPTAGPQAVLMPLSVGSELERVVGAGVTGGWESKALKSGHLEFRYQFTGEQS